ncbi:MAG: terpene cyclase/mutase family protein, partial [bacterium]|nr:terpene cyclase/mutase family protein [bacterium]
LTYNVNPLKISTDNAAPYINATSTITVEQFGLDASWNPVWTAAASSSLDIAGQEAENGSGTYIYTATTTAPVLIYGKKGGFADSDALVITAKPAPIDNTASNNQSGGGSVILPARSSSPAPALTAKVNLAKAIDFLINKQSADGSFGSALVTDWAAMALASVNPGGSAGQKIKSYLLADPNPLVGMNPVSDYARRAMALMSLNIHPYNGTKTNYLKKITDLFDGAQFGDAELYNDDIFALLVLSKAGYAADDEMIKKTVDFIMAKQQADGSWQGVDMTAASIQALKPFSALDNISAAIAKARNFLSNAQGADGGYGNTYTTSWAMQAIASLGEDAAGWQKNNNTPENYLALSQGADGGLEKNDSFPANRVWSTAYTIPAIQGKSWLNIMSSFAKMEDKPALTAASLNDPSDLIATSTLENLNIATSTPKDLITTSSTPATTTEETDKIKPQSSEKTPGTKNTVSAPIKPAEPKVLAVKIASEKTKAVAVNKIEKKPIQKTAKTLGVPKTPSVQTAPTVNPPAPKTSFLAVTGRLIYRGLKYILNLLGL